MKKAELLYITVSTGDWQTVEIYARDIVFQGGGLFYKSEDGDLFIEIPGVSEKIERLTWALGEIDRFNNVHNDLEMYLSVVAEYGRGEIEEKPNINDYCPI